MNESTSEKLHALSKSWRNHWTVTGHDVDPATIAMAAALVECADELDALLSTNSGLEFEKACIEYLKGCSNTTVGDHKACADCNNAFLDAVARIATKPP